MSVKIIADSAADLPEEIINKYDLDVAPLVVTLGEEEYLDGETIKPADLFNGMREGKVYKTAQVPAGEFKKRFIKYAEKGESCINIAFSSELSGTYQTGVLVKKQILDEYPDFDLEIIDTKCASLGLGLIVVKAAEMAKEGRGKDEILELVKFYASHMEHIFTVDDLEYLFRGGRVSRATAFIGGLLNIKPVLNVEKGKLVPLEKVRGKKKVYKKMLDLMEERGIDLEKQTIAICHGDVPEKAELLKEMIEDRFGSSSFLINTIGAVIGAHAGPGTLGVFFLNERSEVRG